MTDQYQTTATITDDKTLILDEALPVSGRVRVTIESLPIAASPADLSGAVETEAEEHQVTWLELFYDLVFVVAVAQLGHRLLARLEIGIVGEFEGSKAREVLVGSESQLDALLAGETDVDDVAPDVPFDFPS